MLVRCSPADLVILLPLLAFSDSPVCASSAAEGSKRGSLCRPAMVGRKNGTFAGFLGGCTGLLRACTDTTTCVNTSSRPLMPHTKLAGFPSISDSCVNARPNDHKLGSLYQKKDQGVRHHMTLLQVVQLKVVLSDSKANRER